jgi:ATP-dependent helicase/nuclease subunit B
MTAIWTIPPDQPFLDALVAGLFERYGREPLSLAGITILLPTRRACRSLGEAFLKASAGAPMLLPRLSALGDLDAEELELNADLPDTLDLAPSISALRRQLLLAKLIRRWGLVREGGEILPGQAVALAADLARLIDQAHTERVGFDQLDRLVPEEHAAHWALTVDFLKIVTAHWPALIEAEGALDPARRRDLLITAQAEAWRARPPMTPIIAAGFGDASPAAAELLGLIAALPTGALVLPGVDTGADAELWSAVTEDPTHPQHGMAVLLQRIGAAHDSLPVWAAPASGAPRRELAREMMRPAATSHHWRAIERFPDDARRGLTRLDLAGPQEEASAIALLLRHRLDLPGATAMLVTPDRGLGRRVAAELARWRIEIDDSAGTPLNQTAPGAFLRLIAEAALERLAPVPLLALLKHPLAGGGLATPAFRDQVRGLERHALRGPRPGPGLDGLRAAGDGDQGPLIDRIEAALGEFLALAEAPETRLAEMLAAHIRAAEALAATDTAGGAERLWALDAGEALANFVAELAEASKDFEPIAGADYPVLFEALIAGRVVRPRWGRHPRLQILGPLEARLQQADLIVLGGLNEGIWPPQAPTDPWLSRPMRREFGLRAPEAVIGLAAHDFAMAFMAPEVVLTRAARVEGAPTVPSRWLLRLDTVLRAAALPELVGERGDFAAYPALLDRPAAIRPVEPPAPTPPRAVRPRKLSVTEIETWMRDPYAIYARRILRLEPLEPLDADPGVAERGQFIHAALDAFIRTYPQALPARPVDALLALGRAAFGEALARPGIWAFWWPRFERIAGWFVALEAERRPLLRGSWTEAKGRLVLDGDFTLTAKADRIDLIGEGGLALIDYKTGTVPKSGEVLLGFSPQLPLEAAIAAAGGFEGVPALAVTELGFWRLSGGDPAGEEIALGTGEASPADLANAARQGLERLIAVFDDPNTPYRARPRPEQAPRWSGYAHLARLLEWGTEMGE